MIRALAAMTVLIVALLHGGFLVLEMVMWESDQGRAITGYSPEDAATTAVLAANQGLYNGFLAAGLLWGLIGQRRDIQMFFLGCVAFAGFYGAWSAQSPLILGIQALPAIAAFALVLMAKRRL